MGATAAAIHNGDALYSALLRYAKVVEKKHGMHRFLINDFARRHDMTWVERLLFSAAAKDVKSARHLHAFGARLIRPKQFMSPRAVLRAMWVNATRRATPVSAQELGLTKR